MGIFNGFGRRADDERDLQRRERELNEEFRRKVKEETIKRDKEEEKLKDQILQIKEELRKLKIENRKLQREQSEENNKKRIKNEQEVDILKQKQERAERKKREIERDKELDEAQRNEARIVIEKIKESLKEALDKKDDFLIEKKEKELKEKLLIFKKRVTDNKYKNKTLEGIKFVAELLFQLGEYYYEKKQYNKALELYLEAKEFEYGKNILINRLIKTSYECGKYEEAINYLEEYKDNDVVSEYMLKLEININLQRIEEAKENIEQLIPILKSDFNKTLHTQFAKLLETFILLQRDEEIASLLYFEWLYLKNFSKMKERIVSLSFEEKDFFEGILQIRDDNENGLQLLKKFLQTIYGASIYFSRVTSNFENGEMEHLNHFISRELDDINKERYIFSWNEFLNKKYEFLAYKMEKYLSEKAIDLEEILQDIKMIIKQDQRGKDFIGGDLFWATLIKLTTYLKKIDNPIYEKFELRYSSYLTPEEIKNFEKGLEDHIIINVSEEYDIEKAKNNISLYRDIVCKNKTTQEKKILIEIFETMNKKTMQEKKLALYKDTSFGKNNSHFLKIDNFSVESEKITIITEDYDRLYEEEFFTYANCTFEEKLEKAFDILRAFEELNNEKIYMLKLNVDNLVIRGNQYKFRFLTYADTLENGSLSSSKSATAKKSSKYRAPEVTLKEKSSESNIYILGLLLYDIFYGEDILQNVIDPTLSLKDKQKVKDAFFEEKHIDKNLVKNNTSDRFFLEDKENNTVKLQKVMERKYLPEQLIALLNKILSFNKIDRPTLSEIKEELERIKVNNRNYDHYLPNIILKEELSKLLNTIDSQIKYIKVREENYKEISPKASYDTTIAALIVIGVENDIELELSDIGTKYSIMLFNKKEEQNIIDEENMEELEDINKNIDEILNKINIYRDERKLKKFLKKNNIESIEAATIFTCYVEDVMKKFKENKVLIFKDEDKEIFADIPTISEESIHKIIEEKNINEMINILNKIL